MTILQAGSWSMACLLMLGGCAAQLNPVGDSRFDCNRRQDSRSPHCRSFKAVDQATDASLPPSRYDKAFLISDLDRLTGISPDEDRPPKADAAHVSAPLLPHQVRNDAPLTGQPVREGPIVQRVWIKRHVDGRDVLTEDTVVYREIRPTRWAGFPTPPAQGETDAPYPRRPREEAPLPTRANPAPATQTPPREFIQPGSGREPGSESAFDPAGNGSQTLPK